MWKRVFKIFISLYLPLLALSLFLLYSQKKEQIRNLSQYQQRDTELKKNYLQEQCYTFLRDTYYWSTIKYPLDFDPIGNHEDFMKPYLELINGITDYDQFRFLDLTGKEFYRVIRKRSTSIEPDSLQDKQDRDYVKAGLALKQGQLYLSQISLNRENGIIENPHKPVIRTVAPIYDANHKKIGLVVINFKMKRVLDKIKSQIAGNNIYLLDESHRIITSSLFKEDVPYEFKTKNSSMDDIFASNNTIYEKDTTYLSNNHIWSFHPVILNKTTFNFSSVVNSSSEIITPSNWVMVMENPPSLINAYILNSYQGFVMFNFCAIILLLAISYIYEKKRAQKDQFYLEVENKNILLTEKSNQLLENNSVIKDINHRLEMRNRQLSEFNYLVSHNLRSPVTTMSVLIEMMKNEKEPEKLSLLYPKLEQVTTSILNLSQDINEYVSIIDNSEIKVDDVDLFSLIDEVKNDFSETLLGHKTFEVIVKPEAWRNVQFSKFYLKSIIQNLMSNAIKYRKNNSTSYIEFETAYEDKSKVLYIRDNGTGLNLEMHGDNLFKLYKRFHRNISGKGMGLFLVKSHLDALDASITVQSEVGKGITFKIIF
ncbi:sensor histidine kinase [Aurantibacter crassamenti]|uniref:sensor histidine kinase n=1 Tax=Aurantibacter crassamenti TaxID=1837375 RepID=UPI00193A215E|nr:sensor histidine kinase [Aurantibacter crassamenti]MBM1104550.1 sensor histidine kinase [Aurantibacter crassamenti]